MKCIIGLGNPGAEYALTRHNVGFLALDFFQKIWKFPDFAASKHFAEISSGTFLGEKILLVKPTTFMNLSGKSVASIVNFYKLDPAKDMLVVSDDIDQEFGKIRFRTKGSSGGQNGLNSIIESLGTDAFQRIKIGIGRDARYEVSDWVLSRFTKTELEDLAASILPEVRKKAEDFIGSN